MANVIRTWRILLASATKRFLAFYALSVVAGWSIVEAGCFPQAWGFNIGATATSEEHFEDPSWTASGSLECFGDRLVQPRALLGIANLNGDAAVRDADATYVFVGGGIAIGRLVYGTVSLGIYHVSLDSHCSRHHA